MEFIQPQLQHYCEKHSSPESEVLKDLDRETHAKVMMPRMLSGHLQGRFLAMITHMLKPKRILEIGTYTGYSAICMAEGMGESAEMITIDINEELEGMVKAYFKRAGVDDKIELKIGNAIDILGQLSGPFDLVFIDADKRNYSNYYDAIIDKVSKGGIIMADNVLWSGKVIDPNAKDKDTEAIRAFNWKVHQDPRVENVLLPIRDGIMMARKIK
jgi:caffeoyl-CoA O-methyltransferase